MGDVLTTSLIALTLAGLAAPFAFARYLNRRREGRRLDGNPRGVLRDFLSFFESLALFFAKRTNKRGTLGFYLNKSARKRAKLLSEAGLETSLEKGRYLLLRSISFALGPAIGAASFLFLIPYYATIFTVCSSAIGVIVPWWWLQARTLQRREEIQRELPLLLDLTNLGISAGWDAASSLERVVDALYPEFPDHPLIKEFKHGRMLIANGYSWNESLKRVGQRLKDDTAQRTTLALTQAIHQGGARTKQLEAIAQDAQRNYYAQLDKRLAGIPVKALFVTVLVFVGYIIIVLAPAAAQLEDILQ